MQVKAVIGAAQNNHEAVSGITFRLWNNFQRSR